mmetsp:Transcript_8025/g.11945  ORF Transcript_8025/g.11945 Transcript_8025/m.11945 type:complete len:613 (-) Transcript_8025:3842-5680(-)
MNSFVLTLLILCSIALMVSSKDVDKNKKIIIVGGGIAGLSSAHLLAERGYTNIHVYERTKVLGGKARSIAVPDSAKDGREPLLGEHGYRIFPAMYKHIRETMENIPFKDSNVWKQLVSDEWLLLSNNGSAAHSLPVPHASIGSWLAYISKFPKEMRSLGIPKEDMEYILQRILVIAESCENRFQWEYDHIRFWDYMSADQLTEATQNIFLRLISTGILAAEPHTSALRTIGLLIVRMFIKMTMDGGMVQSLNGPTNTQFLHPWVEEINRLGGVKFHLEEELQSIVVNQDQKIASLSFKNRNNSQISQIDDADDYIIAIPVEKLQPLITTQIREAAPSMANIHKLTFNNQNGLQFFLKKPLPFDKFDYKSKGHVAFSYSKWAISAINQVEFWKGYDWSKIGDGSVVGIFSVDVSEWNKPGDLGCPSKGRTGYSLTKNEFISEVWCQMHKAMPHIFPEQERWFDYVHTPFLDPDVEFHADGSVSNLEPLFLNIVNATQFQPNATTEIKNLYLASDFVRSETAVACMEAANEGARHAIRALLTKYEDTSNLPQLYKWKWPIEFLPAQQLDCARRKMGLMPIGWDVKPHDQRHNTAAWQEYKAYLSQRHDFAANLF